MVDYALSSNIANLLFAILIAVVIGIFCTLGIHSKNALESLIAEYSVMVGVILILTVLMILNIKSNTNLELFSFTSFITLFPFFWIVFIICYYISLLSKYFDRISSNKVSEYYSSFSNTLVVLLLTQIYMLVSSVAKNPNNPTLSQKTFSILMFLGTINLIVVITIGVILKFYSTDC